MNYESLLDPRVSVLEVTPCWSGDIPMSTMDNALIEQGVDKDMLPKAPTRVTAMKRAFNECAPRGAIVDSLPKGLGVSLTIKDSAKLDLEEQGLKEAFAHSTVLSCKIQVQNINGSEVEYITFTPNDHPMIPLMQEVYRNKRETYKMSEDLSLWFSQTVIPYLGGVAKRSRGGVYYVPAVKKDLLLQVAKALDSVSQSHQIDRMVAGTSVPVFQLTHGGKLCLEPRTAEDTAAVEIMIDNVIREADNTLDELSSVLENNKLGKRALKSKKELAISLEKEISTWESITSASLQFLRERATELQSAIAIAELAAESKEE